MTSFGLAESVHDVTYNDLQNRANVSHNCDTSYVAHLVLHKIYRSTVTHPGYLPKVIVCSLAWISTSARQSHYASISLGKHPILTILPSTPCPFPEYFSYAPTRLYTPSELETMFSGARSVFIGDAGTSSACTERVEEALAASSKASTEFLRIIATSVSAATITPSLVGAHGVYSPMVRACVPQ